MTLCLLDFSRREDLFEGELTSRLFGSIPLRMFHSNQNIWPTARPLPSQRKLPQPTKDDEDVIEDDFAREVVKVIRRDYVGLVLSGSKDSSFDDALKYISLLLKILRNLIESDDPFPIFGICFGAQVLARVTGMKVSKMAQGGEFGFKRVKLLRNPLFEGLFAEEAGADAADEQRLRKRHLFTLAHFDGFVIDTRIAISLGSTSMWPHQAFQLRNKPVFGVQFHPEFEKDISEMLFAQARKLGEEIRSENLEGESPTLDAGKRMLANFYKICLREKP